MLRGCIVGYGSAGKTYHDHSWNILDIVCVVDLQEEVKLKFSRKTAYENDFQTALRDYNIDVVLICTPINSYYDLCTTALSFNKHVLIEKPIATSTIKMKELYKLAEEKGKLLYILLNRRYNPSWKKLKEELGNEYPLHATIMSRDYSYTPIDHLKQCNGIFQDMAIHDLDMICETLEDTPIELQATLDKKKENSSIYLTFFKGCKVTLINSRCSTFYDHRVLLICSSRVIESGGENNNKVPAKSIIEADKSKESYIAQLKDVCFRISSNAITPNVSFKTSEFYSRLIEQCNTSAKDGIVMQLQTLRAYDAAQTHVRNLYKKARDFHTVDIVRSLKLKYRPEKYGTKSVWDVFNELENFVDVSDPDVDMPNQQHALQTAESMRRAGLPDWMQLTGFIHDFGKIIHKWGSAEDGTSMDTQWSIVGDTFIVGCALPTSIIFPEYSAIGCTNNAFESPEIGIYAPKCGLDNCEVSFGHDEYLYQVLMQSNTKLPIQALKMVRYHSLYAWHDKDAYGALTTAEDELIKGWIKLFNSHDLYSKRHNEIQLEDVSEHYDQLIRKYIPEGLHF